MSAPTPAAPDLMQPAVARQRQDRLAHSLILGAGALCFLLLAWGHLGLGALLFPPAPTVARQVASVGALKVTLGLSSGQLTAAGPNTVSFTITDASGRPINDAVVTTRPEMRTMTMDAPAVVAVRSGAPGSYMARPRFAMAGDWRLVVTITIPGQATRTATFNVTVRW
ncbi:MAG TPA: FixH family protein [Ktedonobacterales bacterium]|nr:FixH family protein [Ktedonobacterales bacterium]